MTIRIARCFLAALCGVLLSVVSQSPLLAQDHGASGPVTERDSRLDWWREARFGLFIHWGLYAVPAGEWGTDQHHGEWIYTSAKIPLERYEGFREQFNPVKFDADAWVQIAKDAGMKYIVITSKHHDGFCLFDSAHTDYDIASTPFKRDILKELADACHRAGLRICWYHSIMDWHHPDYLPRRDWEERPATGADFGRYVQYLRAQVEELITKYGDIGVLWFDGEWESTWTHELGQALYDLCRKLAPNIIVNNRVDVGRGGMAGMTTDARFAGDFGTPEQEIPATGVAGVDWETCMTMNEHWGYNKHDDDWKSTEDLIHKLVDIASKGGNFLLNVGPTAEGVFPEPCLERLKGMGEWLRENGEAIYGTSASPFAKLDWGRCTVRKLPDGDTRLYLHIFKWPGVDLAEDGAVDVATAALRSVFKLSGLGNEVKRAKLLALPDIAIETSSAEGVVTIRLPKRAPDPYCSVVALDIAGPPVIYAPPEFESASRMLVQKLRVVLKCASRDTDIRYTLDGSDPVLASARYDQALELTDTTTVKARSFHGEKPVTDIVEATFRKVAPLRGTTVTTKPADGIRVSYYAGEWERLPDFSQLTPISTAVTTRFAVAASSERTGYRYQGFIRIPSADVYEFSLASDDGSRLSVAGLQVVDLDGLHERIEKRGVLALGEGWHELRLDYFNRTGGAALELKCARLGEELKPVPENWLSHTP
ncbi:MAG: alpha-L-fucosidase [Planctomycetota bacterium]